MPYIRSDGAVVQEEPVTVRRVLNWPLDLFWGIVNFFVLFFGSIFNYKPQKTVSGGAYRRPSDSANGRTSGRPGSGATPRPTASNIRGMGSLKPDPCAVGGG